MNELDLVIHRVMDQRTRISPENSLLVALTGIDGSGKGYIAGIMSQALESRGVRVAVINIDYWLNLPSVRFSSNNPPAHFYQHALRFDELFEKLVLPLRRMRSLRLEADATEETAQSYHKHTYEFEDIDVILLEGIFLLKRELVSYYDLSFWIECTFATALQRAIQRSQEGLAPEETVAVYRRLYFPAQEIHFQRDAPRSAASGIIYNDSTLNPAEPVA